MPRIDCFDILKNNPELSAEFISITEDMPEVEQRKQAIQIVNKLLEASNESLNKVKRKVGQKPQKYNSGVSQEAIDEIIKKYSQPEQKETPQAGSVSVGGDVTFTQVEDKKIKDIATEANLKVGSYVRSVPTGKKNKFGNSINEYEATNPFTNKKITFKKQGDATDYVVKEIAKATTKSGREEIFKAVEQSIKETPQEGSVVKESPQSNIDEGGMVDDAGGEQLTSSQPVSEQGGVKLSSEVNNIIESFTPDSVGYDNVNKEESDPVDFEYNLGKSLGINRNGYTQIIVGGKKITIRVKDHNPNSNRIQNDLDEGTDFYINVTLENPDSRFEGADTDKELQEFAQNEPRFVSLNYANKNVTVDDVKSDIAKEIQKLISPLSSEQQEIVSISDKEKTDLQKAGISPKNLSDLYNINRRLFGLDRIKSIASAIVMDRMVGAMAKRAGVTKSEMYGRLEFKKDTEANVLKADNALFQGMVNGKPVTLRNIDVDVVNGFYSPLEKVISETKQEKMPAKQWLDKFARGEEAKWTGLQDWLSQQEGSLSKQDILNYLKDNRISVVEVVKGEDNMDWRERNGVLRRDYEKVELEITKDDEGYYKVWDGERKIDEEIQYLQDAKEIADRYAENQYGVNVKENSDTKFSQYQLEGEKENYKEVLVTLPNKPFDESGIMSAKKREESAMDVLNAKSKELLGHKWTLLDHNQKMEVQFQFPKEYKEFRDAVANHQSELNKKSDNKKGKFKSSHFDEPNILVHLRMNTRTDADGNKVLFLEEIQSDWSQSARKKGFKKDIKYDEKRYNELSEEYNKASDIARKEGLIKSNQFGGVSMDKTLVDNGLMTEEKIVELQDQTDAKYGTQKGLPQAPFVTETNSWTKLGLKVALKEAVKQGADKIAWTTGEQQNDRYDLSKQVDVIDAKRNKDGTYEVQADKDGSKIFGKSDMSIKDIEDTFGKDIAQKINDSESRLINISGDNLKAGGKGMKGFYGSIEEGTKGIVGGVAEKVFGQKVGEVKIEVNNAQVDLDTPPRIVKLRNGEYVVQTPFKDSYVEVDGELENPTFADLSSANEFYINETNRYNKEIERTKLSTQPSIDITPALRAEVERGLALFQRKQGQQAKGAMVVADGRFVIYALTDPNVSTPLHEMAHVFEHYLTDAERKVIQAWANTEAWTTQVSEKFARGFEKYLAEGKAPNTALQKIFDKFKQWLTDIYNGINGSEIDIELNDQMREIYAKMLGEVQVIKKTSKSDLQKAEENLKNAWRNFLNNGISFDGMAEAEKEIQLIISLLGYLKAKGIDIAKGIGNEVREFIKNKFSGVTDGMIDVAQGRMLTDYQKLYDTHMTQKNKEILDDMVRQVKSGEMPFEDFISTIDSIVPNERIKNVFISYVNEQIDPLDGYVAVDEEIEESPESPKVETSKEEERAFIGGLLARPINSKNFPNIVGGNKTDEDVLKRITAVTQEDVQDRKVMVDTSYVRVALEDIKEIALQNANALYMQFGEDWQTKVMDYLSDYLNAANPAQAIGILNVISTDVQQKIEKSQSPAERTKLFKLQDKADELSILFASQASLGINARKILRQFAQGGNMSKLVLDKILTEDTIQTIEEINKIMSVAPSNDELNNATMPIVEPQTAKSRLQKIKENIKQAVSPKSKKRGKISESDINNLERKAEEERKRQGVKTKMSREQILEMLKEESKKC